MATLKAKTDILLIIKKDHQNVKKLIGKLAKIAEKPSKEVPKDATRLAFELMLHAKAEEIALYEACETYNLKFRDFVLEGYHEHALLEDMLKKLLVTMPDKNGEFKAVLTVIKELVEHHAEEEEEKEMFPKIRKAFSLQQRQEMGRMMQKQKIVLKPQILSHTQQVDVEEVFPPKTQNLTEELLLN